MGFSHQVVILAGGLGTRLSEETVIKPKPMVDIGGKPILWHIMKLYSHYGFNDFVICLGYKGYLIKEYFYNYFLHNSDLSIDLRTNDMSFINSHAEPWRVTLVDTGADTNTGGRIKRIEHHIKGDTFFLTYGDGVSDVDIPALLNFHEKSGKLATVTAVQPSGKFGALTFSKSFAVESFIEKPKTGAGWINGGFFALNRGIFDYIPNESTSMWEREPLEALASDGQLVAYPHHGFWKSMDTLRDRMDLDVLADTGTPPWAVWQQPNPS